MFFSFLTARRESAAARPMARLQLELLEDRTLLNSRFVVPMASADNVTTFATLAAALTTPGLNPGDVIQIEPGSAPGNIVNAGLPAVAGLTVRGDPTAVLSAIPQFTVSAAIGNSLTVGPAQEGFAFRHVNIGLIQLPGIQPPTPPFRSVGGLVFTADGTIADSTVTEVQSAIGSPLRSLVEFDGAADLLTGTTLMIQGGGAGSLLQVNAPDGSSTLVSDNVFDLSGVGAGVTYNSRTQVAVTDQLIGNTFVGNVTTGRAAAVEDAGSLAGLTIQNNTISLALYPNSNSQLNSYAIGIDVTTVNGPTTFPSARIIGNVINLSAPIPSSATITEGISIDEFFGGASALIAGNQINAGPTGIGLLLVLGAVPTDVIDAVVQGNDFHGNRTGVEVSRPTNIVNPGTIPVTAIDLGGGSKGSLGGNDFRGFTAPATADSGAIVVTGVSPSAGVVTAQKNSFAAGVDPQSVIWDGSKMAGLANVDVSNNLTGNAAFVAALYADLLKRAGDTSNPNDAGGLIAALDSGALTQAAAASALVHSPEALGVQVDGLYLKLLGRPSDASGRAGFVSFMKNGGSLEQVAALMVSSPEYAALTGSDTGFVQSLYTNLLGRTASDSEVAGYLAALPSQGRAGVAQDFLRSAEFRTSVVDQFYSATPAPTSAAALFSPLLHRAATAAEINGWVASGLSVLDIETAFVSSSEFFVDG